jgi:Uma2 family endonuclease
MATANPTHDVATGSALAEPDGLYEIVDGQVVEKPTMGALQVWIAGRLARWLHRFYPGEEVGQVVSEGLFVIDRARRLNRRPDVAFVTRERWPLDKPTPDTWAWDVVPDLAVEIISATNTADDAVVKTTEYLRAGTRLVWVIYTSLRQIYVYDSPTSVRILQDGDELDGGAVLPGFRVPLTDLFGEASEVQPKP